MKRLILVISLSFFIALALMLPNTALAVSYYASPGGSGIVCSLASPCSLNSGVSKLAAGDILYLRGGTYNQAVSISKSGTTAAPITNSGYSGETVIIDGQYTLPGGDWDPLVAVKGQNVIVRDITVTHSTGEGVQVDGVFSQVINIYAHHNMEAGIILTADYSIADGCRIWYNSMHNENGIQGPSGAGWGTGISACRHPQHATIRNTVSWENWGEGISTFEAEYTTLEDNISYNNWSVNMYISDTTNTVVQRNMIYRTANSITGGGGGQYGLALGDEVSNPPSSDNKILNNFVMGTNRAFFPWSTQRNLLVANNTFVNSSGTATVDIDGGTNVIFRNNIIVQDDSLPVLSGSTSGYTFSNNLWSKTPSAKGSTDTVGNPQLARTGPTTAGALTPQWFMLTASSNLAIDKAVNLSDVAVDFFKNSRPIGSAPDIGAHEYSGAAQPTATLIPSVAPTGSQPTNPPGSTAVSLTLFLHGIGKGGDNVNSSGGGNSSPTRPQRPVTIAVSNSVNQLVATQQGTVTYNTTAGNFQGTVALGTLASGLYTIKVTVPQYLIKTVPGIVTLTIGQTNTVSALYLVTGDSNDDNNLSILDYNMLLDCYSDLTPAKNCANVPAIIPTKKQKTDLTDDGFVNQFDYNLFLRELSVQGGQ